MLGVLAWACWPLTLLSATAAAQVVDLESTAARRGLADDVRYLELSGSVADTATAALAAPPTQFRPIGRRYIDFGATPSALWLRLDVRNAESDEDDWWLSFNIRFMTELVVYLRTGAKDELLLAQTPTSSFGDRPLPFRFLAAPFTLAAGQQAALIVGYRSDGTTALPLSIETPTSFLIRYAWEDAVNIACYASVAFMALLSLLQSALFGQRRHVAYVFYLVATLLYIAHMDGLTFQYVWPDLPAWNSYAAIPLGLMMAVAAVAFSRSFVDTKRVAPLLDKLMVALIVGAVAVSLGGFALDEQLLKAGSYVLVAVCAAACLGAALVARGRRVPAMRFFVLGWSGVFIGVTATVIANYLPGAFSRSQANMLPKLTIMFDTLMFYMALADRARAWRLERDAAAARELTALRVQQETTDRLHRAETERLEALIVAQTKSEQLAMASHDIRQPLASLRLSLERLTSRTSAGSPVAVGVARSLDYLQRLAEEYSADRVSLGPTQRETAQSSFDIADVLHNLDLMFRDEAVAKGLGFRVRMHHAAVCGDAMSAMRVISNLVANAIKYTESGKVLIGCRRRGDRVCVVVADTGPGIPKDEVIRVTQVYERGESAETKPGHGLGLAIATNLAARNRYGFECRSVLGCGTAFFVELARAEGLVV